MVTVWTGRIFWRDHVEELCTRGHGIIIMFSRDSRTTNMTDDHCDDTLENKSQNLCGRRLLRFNNTSLSLAFNPKTYFSNILTVHQIKVLVLTHRHLFIFLIACISRCLLKKNSSNRISKQVYYLIDLITRKTVFRFWNKKKNTWWFNDDIARIQLKEKTATFNR